MHTPACSPLSLPGLDDFDPAAPDLREGARAARLLARASALLITLTSACGVGYVNAAVELALGYAAELLAGRCWRELLAEPASRAGELWGRLQAEDLTSVELLMHARDAEPRLVVWDFQRELDAQGRLVEVVGWGRDITAQRRREQEREALIRSQQQALGARAELLAIAAYELKTPLTLLVGRSQLIQARLRRAGCTACEEQRELDAVVAAGLKLNAMVETLFRILRVEEGQLQMTRVPVDLYGLLGCLLSSLAPRLQQHRVALEPPDQPLVVLGEPRLLAHMFEQLLENAAQYSPQGSLIRLSLHRHGLLARVQIADQGAGMPPAALPRLFQPAAQAPLPDPYARYKMKGGLYIVREVVTLHQGAVDVTSAPAQGTTFTVSLPLFRREA